MILPHVRQRDVEVNCMAKWKGSQTEKFIKEHETFFFWLLVALIAGFVVPLTLDFVG